MTASRAGHISHNHSKMVSEGFQRAIGKPFGRARWCEFPPLASDVMILPMENPTGFGLPGLFVVSVCIARGTSLPTRFINLPTGNLHGAPAIVQVAVQRVDVADDELHLAAAGGLQRVADVGGPGFLVQVHIHA